MFCSKRNRTASQGGGLGKGLGDKSPGRSLRPRGAFCRRRKHSVNIKCTFRVISLTSSLFLTLFLRLDLFLLTKWPPPLFDFFNDGFNATVLALPPGVEAGRAG